MPIKSVQFPDGSIKRVEVPEGATNEQILEFVSSQYQPPASQAASPAAPTATAQPESAPDPTDGMSRFDRFAAGMGASAMSSYRGVKQAGTEAIRHLAGNPDGTADNAVTRWADESLVGQQKEIDAARKADAPLLNDGWGMAGNVAGYGAQVLLPASGLRGLSAAKAFTPTTIAGNAAQGAVLGGTQPVATGESRLANLAAGGAFGAGGAVVANRLSSLAQGSKQAIEPHVREAFEAAKRRGIDLMPGQISNSRPVRWTQSLLRSVPMTGAQGRYDKQVAGFNRELAKTIGEDAPAINSQVYSAAKARQSQEFADLTSRNSMAVDSGLIQKLNTVAAESKMAGDQVSNQVESAIEALYAQATTGPNGVSIPGAAYQALDSQLGAITRSGGPQAHFVGRVQSALREAMDKSISPQDAAAWKALRREYGNRKTLAPLVAKANDGPISPPQVMGAVTNTKSAKERMASGAGGELGELAKIGQLMKEPASSGTAERGFMGAALGGGAMVDPATGLMTAVGLNLLARGMDSKVLARFMMRQNPGMTLEAAEQVIRRSANPVGQNRNASRPLEIDVVGGQPVPRAQLEAELRALGL